MGKGDSDSNSDSTVAAVVAVGPATLLLSIMSVEVYR